MGLIKTSDLTLNAEEVKLLSELIFEGAFQNPALGAFHYVAEGIVAKKKIQILGRLSGLFGVADGECDPTSSANEIAATTKIWDPKMISDRLEQCYKDLQNSFYVYMRDRGIKAADLTSTALMGYMADIVKDAVVEAIYRFAWLGDTAADTVANAGYLKNGTEKKYFNKMNGFWAQFLVIVAATPARKTTSILTTRNAGANYAAQAFTTTDTTNREVSNALLNMRMGSDIRMRQRNDLIYVVTQSVADQYERELINANISYTTDRLENGITVLKNGSIEVYAFNLLDRIITTYMDNGTKVLNPHRAVLTTKTNLQIGTPSESQLTELDVFYDKKTKKNFIDAAFEFDAKVIEDYLVQLSY